MVDHLTSIHLIFFQRGYDWQKYQANFSAQPEFGKTSLEFMPNEPKMKSLGCGINKIIIFHSFPTVSPILWRQDAKGCNIEITAPFVKTRRY